MIDGKIVSGAEEERFNRIKHGGGKFPINSILAVAERGNIHVSQITHVSAVYQNPWVTFYDLLKDYTLKPPSKWGELIYVLKSLYSFISRVYTRPYFKQTERNTIKRMLKEIGLIDFSLSFYEHHRCHAASALFYSGFSDALVVTADGKGHATSISVSVSDRKLGLKRIKRYDPRFSFGFPYSAMTKFLGFSPNDGEYKLMGLAPYGTSHFTKECEKLINVSSDGKIKKRGTDFYYGYARSMSKLSTLFGIPMRSSDDQFTQNHKDLAASIQQVLEDSVLKFVARLKGDLGHSNLCLAGGVGLNVKLNQRIRSSGIFDSLYIQPLAGDNGLSLGAAALKYFEICKKHPQPLSSLGLGPIFSDQEIEKAIRSYGIEARLSKKLGEEVASLIVDGLVVGWFQGGMEFGPRAMGYRSILADATNWENKSKVNHKIKFREGFRPFCPSVLVEDLELLDIPRISPTPYFMIESFEVSEFSRMKFPAVVHVDNSTRPQAVDHFNAHPNYLELLKQLKKRLQVGIVLNTSMNRNGEPIVHTPTEAIEVFLNTGMDCLVLNNYILRKS
jgi:carbamoyltransferase